VPALFSSTLFVSVFISIIGRYLLVFIYLCYSVYVCFCCDDCLTYSKYICDPKEFLTKSRKDPAAAQPQPLENDLPPVNGHVYILEELDRMRELGFRCGLAGSQSTGVMVGNPSSL
jgi:hypothetical protein